MLLLLWFSSSVLLRAGEFEGARRTFIVFFVTGLVILASCVLTRMYSNWRSHTRECGDAAQKPSKEVEAQ